MPQWNVTLKVRKSGKGFFTPVTPVATTYQHMGHIQDNFLHRFI